MTARDREIADQALRDLAELDAQVADGEISAERARTLSRAYEATAATALAAIDEQQNPECAGDDGKRAARQSAPRAWTLAYVLAGVVALVAAVVLLPAAVVDRPEGGAVTGIEPLADQPVDPPSVDREAVDNAQLEQVVAENPDVVGMRLALADRYVAEGDHGAAMRHLVEAQSQRPDDDEVLTRLAWLLLQIDQTGPALENVDRALAIEPDSVEAAWVRANVLLDGTGDRTAGIAALEELSARLETPSDIRSRVDELLADVRAEPEGPR